MNGNSWQKLQRNTCYTNIVQDILKHIFEIEGKNAIFLFYVCKGYRFGESLYVKGSVVGTIAVQG